MVAAEVLCGAIRCARDGKGSGGAHAGSRNCSYKPGSHPCLLDWRRRVRRTPPLANLGLRSGRCTATYGLSRHATPFVVGRAWAAAVIFPRQDGALCCRAGCPGGDRVRGERRARAHACPPPGQRDGAVGWVTGEPQRLNSAGAESGSSRQSLAGQTDPAVVAHGSLRCLSPCRPLPQMRRPTALAGRCTSSAILPGPSKTAGCQRAREKAGANMVLSDGT